ncbi:quinoprotein dehydrogenase-associated SoxYZ-like carrier [Rubrivivax gelatinosus]|uniref:Sulfur-oxidizing protein SoxY n=1 Tax=Rubrivivax gelatinosus TaxID=28068 RepID=A0A4R2MBY7_RUBGE|nr:quinoprotein dehydrogenase-associated SoxYZ-like carrier [Rubrivivax gelatinosus]MBK1687200.1 quinoprotein dehydrogenase-associated SoxYZ-like carrier [Rubrivivax gelatinosus]TCP02605.1 sulfur-oxidizing protein SoxY [Rubrivivax gelatinosus]
MSPTRRDGLRVLAACVLGGAAPALRAAPGGLPSAADGDSSPAWEVLRARLFGERPMAAQDAVQLVAPKRAPYGASVPVKIVPAFAQTPARWVKRLTLVVDHNPSPLAAVLDLTPALGFAEFETRLRVDQYSHVRVVAELSDGTLHTDSRYVKTSGGCSAPPNRDAPEHIGRTLVRLLEPARRGVAGAAEVTVLHPNDTGFELDQSTLLYIPAHFVRSLAVRWAGAPLFDAELDFSVSENPSWRFRFVPQGPGELHAEVLDTHDERFVGRLDVEPAA